MGNHRNGNADTIIMWSDYRNKKEQIIKVCSRVLIGEGDKIQVGSSESPFHYPINEVIEQRQSTIKNYDYYTIKSTRTKGE